ncbi:MAG: hypothetical protein QOG69_113, partial [Actinomycetota bacterium]|nr:hypothetical protein [Actinomycetota bacterium]
MRAPTERLRQLDVRSGPNELCGGPLGDGRQDASGGG